MSSVLRMERGDKMTIDKCKRCKRPIGCGLGEILRGTAPTMVDSPGVSHPDWPICNECLGVE